MKEEALKRLDALAEKLGVVSEHLWAVLVRQQYVEAWFGQIVALVAAVLLVVIWRRTLGRERGYYDDAVLGASLASVPLGIAIVIGSYVAMTGFLNPEYGALREVLSVLR
jgi:hypothetical protein